MITEAIIESKQPALISLSEFMAGNLPAEDGEKEKINPVGIILYAGKTKMVLIGSRTDKDFKEALICGYRNTPEGFDPSQVFDGKNRIIDLSNYGHLKVAQASMGGVETNTFRSIRTLPSVNVTIHTQNPTNGQAETINVDEEELLRVFAGESGGIAVFSGANLPEENVLVMERDSDGKKSGLALFMYPDTDPISALDSVTGLHIFVKTLNRAFVETPRYPLQAESLRALDFGLKTGEYDFGGIEVREELFRTIVIANTRLAARLRNLQYQEFLKSHLPNLGMPEWARFLRRLLMKIGIKEKNLQSLANESIDRLIFGEQIPEDPTLIPATTEKQEIKDKFLWILKTPEARDIWHAVGNDYQYDYYGRQWSFIVKIVEFIQEAGTVNQIEDSYTSLQRLADSKAFRKLTLNYSLTHGHQIRLNGFSGLSHDEHNGSELIQYLEIQLSEKTKQLKP